jgi:hypothetical protein
MSVRRRAREYILAIDPGMTTGLAYLRRDDLDSYRAVQLPWMSTCDLIRNTCEHHGDRLDVVYERFTISVRTAKIAPAPWSLEVIGVARYFSQLCTGQDAIEYEQKPPFATDARLKILGWYTPSQGGHMNDAGRQLLNHLVVCGFRDSRLWADNTDTQRVS